MANASYVISLAPKSPHQPHCNLTKTMNVPTTIRQPKSLISAGILSPLIRHQSLGPCLPWEWGTHEGKGVLPFANYMWTQNTYRSGSCGETLVYELNTLRRKHTCTSEGNLEEEKQETVVSSATGNFHQSLCQSPLFLFCFLCFLMLNSWPKLNQPLTDKSSLFCFITSTLEYMTEVPEVFRALNKMDIRIELHHKMNCF